MSYQRQAADGAFQRGHSHQASSFSAGFSVLPPLSVPDTLTLQFRFVQHGLGDALKGRAVVETLATSKAAQGTVIKSSLLQGVLLVSALAIKPLLSRVIPDHSSSQSTSGIAYVLFHVLWLYPLSAAALYYSGVFRAKEELGGRGGTGFRADRGVTASVVAESYRVLLLANYFAVIYLLRWIPFVGGLLAFAYACIVDSYYCFEAQGFKHGWSFGERIKNLEERWAYYVGFGIPITFLSWWSSDPVVNLALFSLFFPLFQIMSSSSIPQPLDPNLPTSSLSISFLPQAAGSFSMAAAEGGEEARGRKGSPYVPVRLPVVWFADKLYGLLSKNLAPAPKKKEAYGHGHGHDAGGWRGDHAAAPTNSRPYPPSVPAAYQQQAYATPEQQFTSPRRGHVAAESSVGIGGPSQFADKKLDSLISAAARRKKGD